MSDHRGNRIGGAVLILAGVLILSAAAAYAAGVPPSVAFRWIVEAASFAVATVAGLVLGLAALAVLIEQVRR